MAQFEIEKSTNGEYYYRLKASGNKEIILRGEQYASKAICHQGIQAIKANAGSEARYVKLQVTNGQYYFNLKAANGEVIGTSETYTTTFNRDRGMELVKTQAPIATVEDLT